MAEPKTKDTKESVSAFLDNVSDEARRKDCLTVLGLMKEITGEEPKMWGSSIVGFGRYRYEYESGTKGEWPIVSFSPRKNDLTLYLMPGVEQLQDLLKKLGKHKTGKACLYIKTLKDVDLAVLKAMVAKSVEAMSSKRI